MTPETQPLLSVQNLLTELKLPDGSRFCPVDDISFDLLPGRTLCIVGESGCGKSMTALSIMRLISKDIIHRASGRVRLSGADLMRLPERKMRHVRGKRVAMVFQEPMSSLNPVQTIGAQISEMFSIHVPSLGRAAAARRVRDLLSWVGLPDPARRAAEYPHQLSGGMRQRVMIAMALACEPEVLIADEPTSSLDVTIQAQILALFERIQRERPMGLILITHDLGVVAAVAHDVAVMYAGKIVEIADVNSILSRPAHPYTHALLAAVPDFSKIGTVARLPAIPGMVPDFRDLPAGCRFANRCPYAIPLCHEAVPAFARVDDTVHADDTTHADDAPPVDDMPCDSDTAHVAACVRPRAWEAES